MSRTKEVERKKSLLSPEKRALLEKRLQADLSAVRAGEKIQQSSEDVKSVIAACNPQPPLSIALEYLREAGCRQAQQIPPGLDLKSSMAVAEQANRSALVCVCLVLDALGVFKTPGEKYDLNELMIRLQILPSYRKLIRRWFGELYDAGLLAMEGELFVSPQPLLSQVSGELAGEPQGLREMASEEIPAIITGKKHTVEFVFAKGSAEAVEKAYEATAQSRYFNSIVAEVVRTLQASSPPGRQFRLLEVGAGVGGTTTALLPILPPGNTLYAFTDLSNYFLDHAGQKYREYPYLRYGLLDINKDPIESGYSRNVFDVVLGANVIHCARFLGQTLQYIRSLLTHDGVIIMLEYTENRTAHMILPGLLEGFNHFEDERLKDNKPLLSPRQWFDSLQVNGFKDCLVFPEEDSPMNALGQHVIVARAC